MKLVPLADKVVIKMVEVEETTSSGIILSSGSKEKPTVGEVVAVGPGGMIDGKEVVMTLKVGDKVIIADYTGRTVKLDNDEYTIVKQSDVLAIVAD